MGNNRLVEWIRLRVVMAAVLQILTLFVDAQDMSKEAADSPYFRQLSPIIIRSGKPLAVRKGDTVMFDAGRYKTAATFRLSDLLNQLPGFRVDERGRIYFNGKEVNRLLIDGDDLTGEHYALLSSRLRAGLISQVQLLEKYQSVKILKGFQPGEQLAVNLVLQTKSRQLPSGNFSSAKGKRSYELKADLAKLNQVKVLLFARKANLNADVESRTDDLPEAFTLWKDYVLFQPPGTVMRQDGFIPPAYQHVNKKEEMLGLFSVKPDTFSQLKVMFRRGILQFKLHESEEQQYLPEKDLQLMTETNRKEQQRYYQGKIEFERNKNDRRNSVVQLLWLHQSKGLDWQQGRTGFMSYQDQLNQQMQQQLIQIRHEEMFRFSKGILKWESGFGMDNLQDDKIFSGTPIKQLFSYNRKNARLHLSWMRKPGAYQFSQGMMVQAEERPSGMNYLRISSGYLKFYPYAAWQFFPSRKWRHFMQVAAGGLAVWVQGKAVWYGNYHAELRTEWQKKSTLHYFVSMQATQKIQEGLAVVAGPVYLSSRTRWCSAEAFAVPRTMKVQAGLVKMNLYTGLIMNAFVQTMVTRFEQGVQFSFFHNEEQLASFLIKRRLSSNGQISIEKYIHAASIRITCTISYNHFSEPRQLNGRLFETRLGNWQVENRISSHWKIPINLTAYSIFSKGVVHTSKDAVDKSFNRLYRAGCNFVYRLNSRGFVQVQYGYLHAGRLNHFTALDASISYTVKQKYKFIMRAFNLLNNHSFRMFEVTAYGTSDYRRSINGRNFMAGVELGF